MTDPIAVPEGQGAAGVLLALAERVEGMAGPSFLVEQEIADAVGHNPRARLPNYTASLDAALSLIPAEANSAGEVWRAEGYSDPGVLAPHVRASAWVAGAARVYAATPALALTAACLRARAATLTENANAE